MDIMWWSRHDRITIAIIINRGLARDRLMSPHSMARDIRLRYTDCRFNFNANKLKMSRFSSTNPSITRDLIT